MKFNVVIFVTISVSIILVYAEQSNPGLHHGIADSHEETPEEYVNEPELPDLPDKSSQEDSKHNGAAKDQGLEYDDVSTSDGGGGTESHGNDHGHGHENVYKHDIEYDIKDEPYHQHIFGNRKHTTDLYTFVALIDIMFTDGCKRTCTGTIIHDNVVITAAHCFTVVRDAFQQPELSLSFVVLGTKMLFETGYEQYLPIERVVTHPRFRGWTADLALVFTFANMVSDKFGRRLHLASDKSTVPVDSNVTVLSWGKCKNDVDTDSEENNMKKKHDEKEEKDKNAIKKLHHNRPQEKIYYRQRENIESPTTQQTLEQARHIIMVDTNMNIPLHKDSMNVESKSKKQEYHASAQILDRDIDEDGPSPIRKKPKQTDVVEYEDDTYKTRTISGTSAEIKETIYYGSDSYKSIEELTTKIVRNEQGSKAKAYPPGHRDISRLPFPHQNEMKKSNQQFVDTHNFNDQSLIHRRSPTNNITKNQNSVPLKTLKQNNGTLTKQRHEAETFLGKKKYDEIDTHPYVENSNGKIDRNYNKSKILPKSYIIRKQNNEATNLFNEEFYNGETLVNRRSQSYYTSVINNENDTYRHIENSSGKFIRDYNNSYNRRYLPQSHDIQHDKNWRRQIGQKHNNLTVGIFGYVNLASCKKLVHRALPPLYGIKNNNEVLCYSSEDFYLTNEDAGAPVVQNNELVAVTVGGVDNEGEHVAVGMKISCFCSWIAHNLPNDDGAKVKCCHHCCDHNARPRPAPATIAPARKKENHMVKLKIKLKPSQEVGDIFRFAKILTEDDDEIMKGETRSIRHFVTARSNKVTRNEDQS